MWTGLTCSRYHGRPFPAKSHSKIHLGDGEGGGFSFWVASNNQSKRT